MNGIRQTAVVQPGGIVEVQSAELAEGSMVEVIILSAPLTEAASHPLSGLSQEQRISKIREALGGWADDPEIAEIFAEMDKDRHAYQGRPPIPFNE